MSLCLFIGGPHHGARRDPAQSPEEPYPEKVRVPGAGLTTYYRFKYETADGPLVGYATPEDIPPEDLQDLLRQIEPGARLIE